MGVLGLVKTAFRKYPLLANTSIYATFYTAAELSQQTFNKYNSPEKPEIDFKAASRIVAVGTCVYAPTLFYWYKFLDSKFVGKSMKTVITKVAIDQFTMTPFLLASFYVILGYLEGRESVFDELKEKYWKTFVANQCFWIPGQTINFYFMPPSLRIVYISSASFIWINVLCFIKRQKMTTDTQKEL
ncbi:mpv17-like protein [Leguminivora glycinivorella]|uniref:mpv17-like protein n=1 Tax=Leguminivora glycinivorella TaxID=1035111 RepID=UPI00200EB308|nr:mpv17-like protein [Leguminivora glycinivorella]XP_047993864.1 mpv17-like protein [Leguminivora glycinivorella]XP_047993865.1 mpv17-like protein [Leguminivora glycinivorella]